MTTNTNGKFKRGHGATQQYVLSLSSTELRMLMNSVHNLKCSGDTFKKMWNGHDKAQIRRVLKQLDEGGY